MFEGDPFTLRCRYNASIRWNELGRLWTSSRVPASHRCPPSFVLVFAVDTLADLLRLNYGVLVVTFWTQPGSTAPGTCEDSSTRTSCIPRSFGRSFLPDSGAGGTVVIPRRLIATREFCIVVLSLCLGLGSWLTLVILLCCLSLSSPESLTSEPSNMHLYPFFFNSIIYVLTFPFLNFAWVAAARSWVYLSLIVCWWVLKCISSVHRTPYLLYWWRKVKYLL
jgi:hypothetical protein